jgi:hypothetical protein
MSTTFNVVVSLLIGMGSGCRDGWYDATIVDTGENVRDISFHTALFPY